MSPDLFPDGEGAMRGPFDPAVPCRQMETRPCIILPTEDEARDRHEEGRPVFDYPTVECPGVCVRHPDRERSPAC